ncbi:pilus assembly protein HofN [Paramixta manurensis]|uniref:Pilus assembly protein HofN n=1 Tax=Paramixta manurensis TaxID=2740817 RepID=A0A6M8UEV7_9GAMM|nr:pilus assembly protein HofN [Erwiniaceae bacterium PD-1]
MMVWVNLLPWREARLLRRWRQWRMLIIGSLVIALAVNILWISVLVSTNNHLQRAVSEAGAARQQADKAARYRQEALQQQLQLLQRWQQKQHQYLQSQAWLDFVERLGGRLPQSVWLTALQKTAASLRFAGLSLSVDDIALLTRQLGELGLFRRVNGGAIEQHTSGALSFTLTAMLEGEKEDE